MLINQKFCRLITVINFLLCFLLILGIVSVSYAASYTLFLFVIFSFIVKNKFYPRNLIYWLIVLTPLSLLYSIVFILLQKLAPNLLFISNDFFIIINQTSTNLLFYLSILSLGTGIILLWLANKYLNFLNKHPHFFKRILIITIKVFIYSPIGLITSLLFLYLLYLTLPQGVSLELPLVEENKITIEAINNQFTQFNVQENTKARKSSLSKQLKKTNKQFNSIERGLILREVNVIPLNLNNNGLIYLELENGTIIIDKLCADI